MTCHNRRAKTVACVESLRAAAAPLAGRYRFQLYLTDDGSTDGTADGVLAIDPDARILRGSGDLFWNGGMHRAFAAALADGHDFYLWLNDDVTLFPDGLQRLFATFEEKAAAGPAPIVVGATCDDAGRTTYGGVDRPSWWKRTTFRRQTSAVQAARCETFNGNCVLIPSAVAARLGNLDPRFAHAMGDLDYGLRARALDIPRWVMAGHVGRCINDHAVAGSHDDRSLPLAQRWRKVTSNKALEPASWAAFCRRHAGPVWPLFWAWPYARTIATSLLGR